MPSGSLIVVGTGITFAAHTTDETRGHISRAERVFYGVADPASCAWIKKLNPVAESLPYYLAGRLLMDTYELWVDRILEPVREGFLVCAVFHGHPGVYVYASHQAMRRAKAEGHRARMLPGISAEACLIADLGVDPANDGWQSYEVNDFLFSGRQADTSSPLILWQVGLAGILHFEERLLSVRGEHMARQDDEKQTTHVDATPVRDARLDEEDGAPNVHGTQVLVEVLQERYGAKHEVIVYEAPLYVIFEPVIRRVPVGGLADVPLTALSTLYVPPLRRASVDFAMVDRLGLRREDVERLHGHV